MEKGLKFLGKDPQGNAKGVSVDDHGDVVIGGKQTDRISRSNRITSGKYKDLYYEGAEEEYFISGYGAGNRSQSKENGYLQLQISNNPSTAAVGAYVTEGLIDLTDVNFITIDWELINDNGSSGNRLMRLIASTERNGTHLVHDALLALVETGARARQEDRLNVSDLEGEYYVRFHLSDTSSNSADATLKVYGLNLEYNRNQLPSTKLDGDIAKEIERTNLIKAGLRSEVYYKGTEYIALSEGYDTGNGSVTKKDEFIEVKISNNPSTQAQQTVVTNEEIDLTDVNWVNIDWEMINDTSGSEVRRIRLVASTSKASSLLVFDEMIDFILTNRTGKARAIDRLDVSALSGKYFIRFHLADTSSNSGDATLKVYGLSIDQKQPSKILRAKDFTTGEEVFLTALNDGADKHALRVVDAAPFAYDEANNNQRVSLRDRRVNFKKHIDNGSVTGTLTQSNGTRWYFGENAVNATDFGAGQLVPFDITGMEIKHVRVYNNSDSDILADNGLLFFDSIVAGSSPVCEITSLGIIAAGASKVFKKEDIPELGMFFKGMSWNGRNSTATGTVEIILNGGA